MPRMIRRRTAKPAGTKAVSNVRVMSGIGIMQSYVQLTEGVGTEVGRGNDSVAVVVVVGTLQSTKEVELQELVMGSGVVVFGCITSVAIKERQ